MPPASSLGPGQGTTQQRPLHPRPTPTRATHQDGRNHQRLVGQRLRQVDVQGGGVHGQRPVRVPHPDLRQRGRCQLSAQAFPPPTPEDASALGPALPSPPTPPRPPPRRRPGEAHLPVALPGLLQDA